MTEIRGCGDGWRRVRRLVLPFPLPRMLRRWLSANVVHHRANHPRTLRVREAAERWRAILDERWARRDGEIQCFEVPDAAQRAASQNAGDFGSAFVGGH